MSRNYQQESYAQDSFRHRQNAESGESIQNREYRDLYNPYKSNWKQALSNSDRRSGDASGFKKKDFPSTHESYQTSTHRSRYGSFASTSPHTRDSYRQSREYSPYENNGSNSGRIQVSHRDSRYRGPENTNSFQNNHVATTSYKADKLSDKNTYGHYTTGYGPRD